MPAGLPGSTAAQNAANPSAGAAVIFDLLSGPKGSPKDGDNSTNASTGALCTGIGYGPTVLLPGQQTGPFASGYVPGVTKPDGTAAADSTLMYIGGGKCTANVNGTAPVVPYTAGFGIGAAGNGGARDAGAGPAFTGFSTQFAIAAADVANGADLVTGASGFVNRSGMTVKSGQGQFGINKVASAAVA